MRDFAFPALFLVILSGLTFPSANVFGADSPTVSEGRRPYELDWANRLADEVPSLIDFEQVKPEAAWEWTVQTTESAATFERSAEQKIWGNFTAKLTYRCVSEKPAKAPAVEMLLSEPVLLEGNPNVPEDFDAISCWVYGNNWSWVPDPTTPHTQISAIFLTGKDAQRIEIRLGTVSWKEWFLLFQRLSSDEIARLRTPGTRFAGFVVRGGWNREDRTLFFDALALRRDPLSDANSKPLTFSERPRRGVVIPEQNQGTNTGKGSLPFPTRPETILPETRTPCQIQVTQESGKSGISPDSTRLEAGFAPVHFRSQSEDGTLECVYAPSAKDAAPWDALSLSWNAGPAFQPLKSGGVQEIVLPNGKTVPVGRHTFDGAKLRKDGVLESRWRVWAQRTEDLTDAEKQFSVPVTYQLRMKGRTLILETRCEIPSVALVSYGTMDARQVQDAKLVPIPYCTYAYNGINRPETVVFRDGKNQQLFLMGLTDWYLGNGSVVFSRPNSENDRILFNSGVRYQPKTDGTRNPCFERFFVTVSPEFQEVLPTIPNPPSPWISLMGSHQWHARGAENREADKKYWFRVWRHGIREMIVVDHEVGWRDAGESFTFRTRTAPGKGGDEGQRDFSEFMNQKLNYFYGPYNNFTDFAPVNGFWNSDLVSRSSDGQMMRAWPRCYAPKPSRAVEFCEKLTPVNQEKYHFRLGYCDVHTAVSPSERVDYDSRVPGAGTYASTFYAFGEIMLLQKKGWGGPVFSEGPMQHFYAGLNDGSYAQDQGYQIAFNPWIVDYELLKVHPLSCNIGMGNPIMFYAARNAFEGVTESEKTALLDRFFAATLAFGHPGYLPIQYGMEFAWRGYFGTLALQKHYTQCQPAQIRYCDADGRQLTTSEALANDAYRRSQLVVTYEDGTVVCANGSPSEPMSVTVGERKVSLPPTGYSGWTRDGKTFTFSGLQDGTRCDYAVSPDYVFLDGRGTFQQFPCAAGSGAGVCRKTDENHWEVLTLKDAEMGFRIPDQLVRKEAVALNFEGTEIGKTSVSQSRGYFYVKPFPDAFSYRIETVPEAKNASSQAGADAPSEVAQNGLSSSQFRVLAGQTVTVSGPKGPHAFTIPKNAVPGSRIWFEAEGNRIDFWVTPLLFCEQVSETVNSVTLRAEPGLEAKSEDLEKELKVTFRNQEIPVKDGTFTLPLPDQKETFPYFYAVNLSLKGNSQTLGLQSSVRQESVSWPFAPENCKRKMEFRNQPATQTFGTSGAVVTFSSNNVGAGVKLPGFFRHPPYRGGVGRVFLDYELKLPEEMPLAFCALVGKKDGCEVGDGIWFRIAILEDGKERVLTEVASNLHEWQPIRADLSAWRGKAVQLRLISDCGPTNNTQGDWGQWGDLRLISATEQPVRKTQILPENVSRTIETPETKPISVQKMRQAAKGWLCYCGKGLDGSQARPIQVLLNGKELGFLKPATGNEQKGQFSPETRIPLTDEAIAALEFANTLELVNPQNECFSIRDFRLLLEFSDGTQISSLVNSAAYSQPGHWAHAEGIRIPEKKPFFVPIWLKPGSESSE